MKGAIKLSDILPGQEAPLERLAKKDGESGWHLRECVIGAGLFQQGEAVAKLAVELARQSNLLSAKDGGVKRTKPREKLTEAWELVREACRLVSFDHYHPPGDSVYEKFRTDFIAYLRALNRCAQFEELCNPQGGTLPPIKLDDGTLFFWQVYQDEGSFRELLERHAERLGVAGSLKEEPCKYAEQLWTYGRGSGMNSGFRIEDVKALAETRHLMILGKGKGRRGARGTSAKPGESSKREGKSSRRKG